MSNVRSYIRSFRKIGGDPTELQSLINCIRQEHAEVSEMFRAAKEHAAEMERIGGWRLSAARRTRNSLEREMWDLAELLRTANVAMRDCVAA